MKRKLLVLSLLFTGVGFSQSKPSNVLSQGAVQGQPVQYCGFTAGVPVLCPATGAATATFDITKYGASTSLADNSTAVASASTAAAAVGGCVTGPNGVFTVTHLVNFAANAGLCLHTGTTIRATASMAAVIETPLSTQSVNTFFSGGIIDANGFATDGLFLQNQHTAGIENILVTGALMHGIHVGNQSAPNTSIQVNIGKGVQVILPTTITQQSGSSSLFFDKATDSTVDVSYLGIGYQIGEIASSGNITLNGHVWGAPNQQLSTGFELLGGTDKLGSGWVADTPIVQGVLVSGAAANIGQGLCYEGSFGGVDNVAKCINISSAGLTPTIGSVTVFGATSSLRFASDVTTPSLAGLSVGSLQDTNVVTQLCSAANCAVTPDLIIGSGPKISNPPDVAVFWGTINLNTAGAGGAVNIQTRFPITITQVDVSIAAEGVGCTTFPTVAIKVAGTNQASVTVSNINSSFTSFLPLGTPLNVATGTIIGIDTGTAAAGCTTTPGTATVILHYVMQ